MPPRRAGRVERWRAVEERVGLLVRWERTRDMVELMEEMKGDWLVKMGEVRQWLLSGGLGRVA